MPSLVDPFGRAITYLRVSITDRCDFRCRYCMAEDTAFVPRRDLLTLEEIDRVCAAFVARGVRKIRITGGEPLVRRNVASLFHSLGRHLEGGALGELALTTNGSQLARYVDELAACGVKRVNVSLDTLDAARFRQITRQDRLAQVLEGIAAAKAAGLEIKINKVAFGRYEDGEFDAMLHWCGEQGFDLTLIEMMPLGEAGGLPDAGFLPLAEVRRRLSDSWTLADIPETTGGPARYMRVEETGRKLGFITPLSAHFCDACNRVRLTCTGTLFMCLGQEDSVDLRTPLRADPGDGPLGEAIDRAIARKPKGHEFTTDPLTGRPAVGRHMNLTGG
ncbi:MAG: GTP 3',8-cyclase MoaA [Magnetospirillum sp. WYHS-4]